MLRLITLPFRWVRAARYVLIAAGAIVSGLGLWMQIKGVPPAGESVVSGLRGAMALVMDGPTTIFGVFSKIGGVMALLGLLGMTVHDMAPANKASPDEPDDQPQPMTTTPAVSTWQERLAAKTGPQPTERAVKSTGVALRIGVIGLVICAFLAVLDGSCKTPLAALAELDGAGRFWLRGAALSPDGAKRFDVQRLEAVTVIAEAARLGTDAGAEILARAGRAFLTG